MPFKLRKAPNRDLYWVVNVDTGKKYSKEPIPKERAQAQMRVLINVMEGGAFVSAQEWKDKRNEWGMPFKATLDESKYVQNLTKEGLPVGFTRAGLMRTYSAFNAKQQKKYPTFDSYIKAVVEKDANRLKGNRIGDEMTQVGLDLAKHNNQVYADAVKADPSKEDVMFHGRTMKRGEAEAAKQQEFLDWEKVTHPENAAFFRPATEALSKIADIGVQVLPVPGAVKWAYQNFAPPTSTYYKDNKIKAIEKLEGNGRIIRPTAWADDFCY